MKIKAFFFGISLFFLGAASMAADETLPELTCIQTYSMVKKVVVTLYPSSSPDKAEADAEYTEPKQKEIPYFKGVVSKSSTLPTAAGETITTYEGPDFFLKVARLNDNMELTDLKVKLSNGETYEDAQISSNWCY